jgi:hypothetical protein
MVTARLVTRSRSARAVLTAREDCCGYYQFGSLDVAALKDITAADQMSVVYNRRSGARAELDCDGSCPVQKLGLFMIGENRQGRPIVAAPRR